MNQEILKAVFDQPLDNEPEVDARLASTGLDPKTADALKAIVRLLAAFRENVDATHIQMATGLAGLTGAPEVEATMTASTGDEASEEEGEETTTQKREDPMSKLSSLSPEAKAEIEAMFKATNDRIAKAESEAYEANVRLAKAVDMARTKECIEKANREFPMLGSATKVGAILKKLHEAGTYSEIEPLLKAANAKANAASLFGESGTARGWSDELETEGEESAERKLAKRAQVIASTEKVSLAKAYREALKEDRQAYSQYDAAHKARTKGAK